MGGREVLCVKTGLGEGRRSQVLVACHGASGFSTHCETKMWFCACDPVIAVRSSIANAPSMCLAHRPARAGSETSPHLITTVFHYDCSLTQSRLDLNNTHTLSMDATSAFDDGMRRLRAVITKTRANERYLPTVRADISTLLDEYDLFQQHLNDYAHLHALPSTSWEGFWLAEQWRKYDVPAGIEQRASPLPPPPPPTLENEV